MDTKTKTDLEMAMGRGRGLEGSATRTSYNRAQRAAGLKPATEHAAIQRSR